MGSLAVFAHTSTDKRYSLRPDQESDLCKRQGERRSAGQYSSCDRSLYRHDAFSMVVGNQPNKLALAGDASQLYIGLDGDAAIRRVDIVRQRLDLHLIGTGD